MVRLINQPHNSFPTERIFHASDSDHSFQVLNHLVVINQSQNSNTITCNVVRNQLASRFFLSNEVLNFHFGLILIDAVLVIFLTRTFSFLFKHLKQPKVVCEVIGGIIVGPSVLSANTKLKQIFLPEHAKFIIRNIGNMGFMYFLFYIGVKMDLSVVKLSKRNHRVIALVSLIIPMILGITVATILRPSMDDKLAKASAIGGITAGLAVTGFPVIYPILQESNLLSSEIGQMALSISVITDAISIVLLVTFQAMRIADNSIHSLLFYVTAVIAYLFFSYVAIQRAMTWISEKTPEGQPIEQAYIILVFLAVLTTGFLADMLGLGIATGPLWLGLFIPDGPPVGSTIVERSETLLMEILMPIAYVHVGTFVDVFEMARLPWSTMMPLFAMTMAGFVSKILATMLACLIVRMPWKDALTLSLILNLRGQQEFILFIHWMDRQMIDLPSVTILVLLATATTAITTPFITLLYDPSRPYMVNARRTIQHTAPYEELRVVACIHDEDSVASLVNLLECSYPSQTNPLSVYSLHLVELVGRAAPVFIDHEVQNMPTKYASHGSTQNALKNYKEAKGDFLLLHSFTAVVPKETMYQDICKLAVNNEVSLIILPLHKEWMDSITTTEVNHQRTPSLISNVLEQAPCSAGVLVHKGLFLNPITGPVCVQSIRHILVLFLGGADAREALCYADRMVMNPDASLTVVRFLSEYVQGEYQREKKLDDGLITWFWARNDRNPRVAYREVVVNNGEETMAAIQAFSNGAHFDLWLLGRKQGINPVILEGLSNWSEHHELGAIGDFITSRELGGEVSVLVVQQQILRG